MIGAILGSRYRVKKQLGEGAMGQVYLAEHLILNRLEAIKVLQPDIAAATSFVSRFRREARATNRLQHPNIVSVYDFGQLPDGRLYLSMEYADGDSLDKVITREGPMAVTRALAIAHQITSAVEHAHERGVVHRDLKPDNMILATARDGRELIKVLDFGIAKIILDSPSMAQLTQDGDVFGTAAYMAPESFRGASSDPRVDLYAIGCILFELLTGRVPYAGDLIKQMEAHTNAPIPRPTERFPQGNIDPVLDSICAACMAKNPDERFPTASALKMALEQVPAFPRRGGARRARSGWGETTFGGSTTSIVETDVQTLVHGGGVPETVIDSQSAGQLSSDDDDIRELLREALRELAEGLLDFSQRDSHIAAMTVATAAVIGADDDLTRNCVHVEQLHERELAVEQAHRERESSLRFAIGELAFEREHTDNDAHRADLTEQIEALEERLRRLVNETDAQLESITHERVSLAAELADINARRDAAYSELRKVVDRDLPLYESSLEVAPLVDRYQSIAALVSDTGPTLRPA